MANAGSTINQGAVLAERIPPSQYICKLATTAISATNRFARRDNFTPALRRKGMEINRTTDTAIFSANNMPLMYMLMKKYAAAKKEVTKQVAIKKR
jgi:hypothetical protein